MIIIPQDTTLGSLTYYDQNKLTSILIQSGDISYGLKGNKTFKIITGKDSTEEELPIFNYPYLINENILIDERPFVKDKTKYELEEMLNLRLPFETPLLSGILIDKEDINEFRQFYIKLIQILVGGRLKNILNLSISDSTILNNILSIYATNIITDYNNIDAVIGVAQNNVIGETIHENDLKAYVNNLTLNSIPDVCYVLSKIGDLSRTANNITPEIIYDAVGSLVFNSHRLPLLVGLESPYTMLAITYTYLTNSLYNKTGIVFSINIFKNALNIQQFEVKIKTILKDYKVDKLF